ncbi:MAG TPA: hypothetical protein VLF68_02175 [Candidatus Saccharimonadales bacterium]|nr:hypothetical protein [Candidatus Saccharimonadales bacterium]
MSANERIDRRAALAAIGGAALGLAIGGAGNPETAEAQVVPPDARHFETGVNGEGLFPFDVLPGQVAYIDAAHAKLDGQSVGDKGPQFLVVHGPFEKNRILITEGQGIIPPSGFEALRLSQRLGVALEESQRDFVPNGQGGVRPRQLPKTLGLQVICQ